MTTGPVYSGAITLVLTMASSEQEQSEARIEAVTQPRATLKGIVEKQFIEDSKNFAIACGVYESQANEV